MRRTARIAAFFTTALVLAAGCGAKTGNTGRTGTGDGPREGRDGGGADGAPGGSGGEGGNTSDGGGNSGGSGATPGNVFVDAIDLSQVDKIDLLFMIDNSISMADKQQILQAAVPDLVGRLVNPVCVPSRSRGQALRDVEGDCPNGYEREFAPIRNIHVGIITSSLYVGSSLCHPADNPTSARTGTPNPQLDDSGWLLGARPRATGSVAGVNPEGFLAWNANENPSQSPDEFSTSVAALVGEAGESGCGFESSLEAWYRFLVDPEPYEKIEVGPCAQNAGLDCAYPTGVDESLLAQRAAFLRPDSLVAVILLSDENDCSIQGKDQLFYIATQNFAIPKASAACATNPNDPCCYNCGLGPPAECATPDADPACLNSEQVPSPDREINLRCWEQKRRFGYDFLYPTDRYVNALSERSLCVGRADLAVEDEDGTRICPNGQIQPNGLFADPAGVGYRPLDLVFLAGIIGVPWQDIQAAEDVDGQPYPGDELHFLTAEQLHAEDLWPRMLLTLRNGVSVSPTDLLMTESRAARGGSNAVTGEMLQPPSAGFLANSINGHEWVPSADNDLMYACIFPLAEPRDCKDVLAMNENAGCDCPESNVDVEFNPLCQAPDGSYSTVQRFAKAYPGTRQLEVLRGLDDQAIVASICARNVDDPTRQDYGYRPAMDAIVDRLREKLSGRCLPRQLSRQDGVVPCTVVEAVAGGEGSCEDQTARSDLDPELVDPVLDQLEAIGLCGEKSGQRSCNASSFELCAIDQLPEDDERCQSVDSGNATGWCYIDDSNNEVLASCPDTEKRLLRFVDPVGETPRKKATTLIVCPGAAFEDTQ